MSFLIQPKRCEQKNSWFYKITKRKKEKRLNSYIKYFHNSRAWIQTTKIQRGCVKSARIKTVAAGTNQCSFL